MIVKVVTVTCTLFNQSLQYQSNIVIFMSFATDETEAKIVEEQIALMEDEHDERGEKRMTL